MTVRVFIQARMSSSRFPGKVLAPLHGRPLIAHVIERVAQIVVPAHIVVATSCEPSDDPLACYLEERDVAVFRGSLNNVFARFQDCLRAYPCDWFFRICADSPLMDGTVLQRMLNYLESSEIDLVTNVYPRTFPKGHSAELINAITFVRIAEYSLSAEEQEHVTKVFYNRPVEFQIVNIASSSPELAALNFTVDTVEDLIRLERSDHPALLTKQDVGVTA